MKITFFSNFLNHHQLPFCMEMVGKLGSNFKFVVTEKIPEERIKLGYDDMNNAYDFVVRSYEDEKEAFRLGLESDVVIIGSAPSKYIKKRLKYKKLTFRYSERIFKRGFNIRTWLSLIKNYTFKERKNVYLLCSSAYAAHDYNCAFAFRNRTLKWGYFPKSYEYDIEKLIAKKEKNKVVEILWVGRLVNYKHPEYAIEVAKRLKDDNIRFKMNIIGTGNLENKLREYIKDNELENEVYLLGAVNNKLVRSYMESANIYLFTSDYEEGWGAVLNEAMNSACAVVACHAIGAVPFMVRHNQNALIYKNGSKEELFSYTKELITNSKKRTKIAKKAYNTINDDWNASVASNRLLEIINDFKRLNKFKDGPCSIAKNISQNKMYDWIMSNENG
ncbi:MAG: glycosyltransferase [Bacilli bacterium]|nr:glycosyltransferase [Bacilli bacterium]